jgi:uncharacterized protein (DUF1800 family)
MKNSTDMKHWQPYKSSEQSPWNLPRVWMLHRRAGFGANWGQLQRDLKDGHQKSVARILAGESRDAVDDDFESTAKFLLKKAVQSRQISRLSAWWILRMYLGPDPFAERQTLMWHNHFATSNRTIQNPFRMYRQNQIFREQGTGKFSNLLDKAIKDPAMLLWLNANDNRQGHPNENLGRELLELFSLGVGNYTERDVKEAARALAGWTVNEGMQQTEDPFADADKDVMKIRNHWLDRSEKTILGETGNWDGEDLLGIALKHPATSKRLAWRVCDDLFGENVVSDEALAELAAGLVKNDLDMNWIFETVLNSNLFFSKPNLKSRIAPPETFVLGTLIALRTESQPASALALDNVMTSLGRSLFQPPNVGGWDGGRLWLNARTLVARSNFVHNVVHNGMNRKALPPDFDGVVDAFEDSSDDEAVVCQLGELLLGLDRNSQTDQAMIEATFIEALKKPVTDRRAFVTHLFLNSSSSHLC